MNMKKRIDDIVFLRAWRLYLRPPTKKDICYFLRWLNDPEVRQYLGLFMPVTEADEIEWLDRLHKHKNEESFFSGRQLQPTQQGL
jgi:RimJ/RimL family protein N-acetyltransferase